MRNVPDKSIVVGARCRIFLYLMCISISRCDDMLSGAISFSRDSIAVIIKYDVRMSGGEMEWKIFISIWNTCNEVVITWERAFFISLIICTSVPQDDNVIDDKALFIEIFQKSELYFIRLTPLAFCLCEVHYHFLRGQMLGMAEMRLY